MERLYNNIQLPDVWPPKNKETTLDQPLEVPYLSQKPDIIDIRVGRQLFVDDFLIAETDLVRVEGKPETQPQPLLQPETEMELNSGTAPAPVPSTAVSFMIPKVQPTKCGIRQAGSMAAPMRKARMACTGNVCMSWTPAAAVTVFCPAYRARCAMVMLCGWICKLPTKQSAIRCWRFTVALIRTIGIIRLNLSMPTMTRPRSRRKRSRCSMPRPTGLHWTPKGETGPSGDNTTFFYNPFRKKWIYSMRTFSTLDSRVRVRGYYETDDLFAGKDWKAEDVSFWSRTDIYDRPDSDLGYYTQLYNLDAVGYESVMLGMYSVFMGRPTS